MSRHLLRTLGFQLVCLLLAGSANATPILIATFEAVVPDLTITHSLQVVNNGVTTDTTTTTHVANVPVTGAFTFDGAIWAATTLDPAFAPFPVHTHTVTNPPSGGGSNPGVTTTEFLRASMSIGGGLNLPLDFNRDMVSSMPAGSTVIAPFQSDQTAAYLEGSEDLAAGLGFEGGDVFLARLFNLFSYVTPNASTPSVGEVIGFGDSNSLALEIGSGFGPGPLSFFGPGAPFAFSWVDGAPGVCLSVCDSFVTLVGNFGQTSERTTFLGPQLFQFDTTSYGGQLVFSRVDLQEATVPEPATITLLGVGLLGCGVAGRRRLVRAAHTTMPE